MEARREESRMANRCMKRSPVVLAIEEMQITTGRRSDSHHRNGRNPQAAAEDAGGQQP